MSANPTRPLYHLTVGDVLEIHTEAIGQFGGFPGVQAMSLLESAVAAPQASRRGAPVYTDPIEVAAAYLFFLSRNRPFIDGNERAALGACTVFLRLNGLAPESDGEGWEDLTLDIAASDFGRDKATRRLRGLVGA